MTQITGPKISSCAAGFGVVGHVEHGRLEVVAPLEAGRAGAAAHDGGAGVDRGGDVVLAALALRRRDERAEQGRGVGRVADLQHPRDADRLLEDLRLAVLGHEHAGRRDTGLTGVGGEHGRAPHRRPLDRVGEVELHRLAAELEQDALHGRRGLRHDRPPHRGGAGEAHAVDRGVRRQQLAALDSRLRRRR